MYLSSSKEQLFVKLIFHYLVSFFLLLLLLLLFRAVPAAHGVSQARGLIGATATSLHHSHSNAGSEPRLRHTPQLLGNTRFLTH